MADDPDGLKATTPWTPTHEKILVDWADKAMCYRWMHARAHQKFARKNALFTIPVIIMSTVTGTVTLAQPRFPEEYQDHVAVGVGVVNILAGVLTTVQQFLKIGELNEAHRACGISWDKFYRNIKVELAKCPEERQGPLQVLKAAKEEYDRLMETSPAIQNDIVRRFNETFPETSLDESGDGEDRPVLKKPEVCDALVSCQEYVYDESKAGIKDREDAVLPRLSIQEPSAPAAPPGPQGAWDRD